MVDLCVLLVDSCCVPYFACCRERLFLHCPSELKNPRDRSTMGTSCCLPSPALLAQGTVNPFLTKMFTWPFCTVCITLAIAAAWSQGSCIEVWCGLLTPCAHGVEAVADSSVQLCLCCFLTPYGWGQVTRSSSVLCRHFCLHLGLQACQAEMQQQAHTHIHQLVHL